MQRSLTHLPAVLGGKPRFATPLTIVSPRLPELDDIAEPVREILRSGQLTNNGKHVRELESSLSNCWDVPHVVCVSNATDGLILALAGLKLEGEVIVPSFTFSATAHALRWAGLQPAFADILPDTYTLDPSAVEAVVSPRTSAVLAVHVYGHPCEIDELVDIAARRGLALLFDSAHAFGATYRNRPIASFGDGEVFSFHATKVFPVGEGGCVSTTRSDLAQYVAAARNFGDCGNENTSFCGQNAKMQEFNAIIGLAMLKVIDEHIANRRRYAARIIEQLALVPGLSFQTVRPYVSVNYQNLVMLVDESEFGLTRDELCSALAADNIRPRKYFYPPLHLHEAYREWRNASLPVTERVSSRALCLPFYSEMTDEMIDGLCTGIASLHYHAKAIRSAVGHGRRPILAVP